MVYGSNVLPQDAAYYELHRASIESGVLHITSGGYAKCVLDRTHLSGLTESFKINLAPAAFTDSYVPKIYVHIDVETAGDCYNYTLFPTYASTGVYTAEISFSEADYETFTVEIVADEDVSFALWELCPQSVGDVEVVIEGVKQSLPRLLSDYNTTEIIVEQSEQIVGMINCYLISNTDLQGHFSMNFTASERCVVYVRFFDTEMVELFSPVVYTVNPGYDSVEVPHAYLTKLAGVHSFYVTAQCTNGYLTVPIRGVLYTIDGGYLAERLMNPGMDVSDITIRQLSTDREPSEIWAIGVDNGRVLVKKRVYDLRKPNTAWDAVYLMGEGTLGAIEFDGKWIKREGVDAYTIETYNLPVIAWVDTEGTLWLHQYGDTVDPIQIDVNVTCISMVRGYKSEQFLEQDQGVVLCWVKDKNVYYKQYAYFDGAYQWYPTEQLTDTGDVYFAQVHRLNDYRVGIVTQQEDRNVWYITDRTYVSQAVSAEIFRSITTGLHSLIYMTKAEEENISFDAVINTADSYMDPQSDFLITFPYPVKVELYNQTPDQWKFYMQVIVNSVELENDEYEFSIEGNTLRIHLSEPIWGSVRVKWNKIGYIFYLDETRYIVNTTAAYDFTWRIRHLQSHTVPKDTFNASIDGVLNFMYVGQQKLRYEPVHEVPAQVVGSADFTNVLIAKHNNDAPECIEATLIGPADFTMILVGNQPI